MGKKCSKLSTKNSWMDPVCFGKIDGNNEASGDMYLSSVSSRYKQHPNYNDCRAKGVGQIMATTA